MTSNRSLATPLVAGWLLISSPSWAQTTAAQPSAADLESARELYKEGKELRTKGDLRGALERFKAALGYGQTPVTGLELGKTHLALGELVEAREVLLGVARIKVASDETEKSDAARKQSAELAEEIRPRIPTLVVRLSGVSADATPQVTVDGASVPVVSLTSMRKVNPGDHNVTVRLAGRETTRSATLVESETKQLTIDLTDTGLTAGSGSAGPEAPRGRSIHVVTWIGLGVGVAGLAVGTIAGVVALGSASEVSDACVGLSCPPSSRSEVESGRSAATVSTIGFSAGALGLAAAAVGYFVLSPSKKAARATGVHVALTPSWAGLHGSF
ncbi:MAG: hypothetical protein K0S65_2598 [Labilithrix sp.]|nr:hypothetical protein [Labilithrix sp.]